ncbi:acyl-CoA N-acyltransferase [Setomelanomma holmii]|uniref:Acyl-CoA N-acyltransferase n=1 Tax=Setomelanomma holmii TaxID=210430 RepID=A0A9P4H781_9PLEO|nr:acyl-CoA N-acyltransferase [Setomelanomma holmii]
MPFQIAIAQPHDAARIMQIHMDAFGTNVIIRAIHAADKDLTELRKVVEEKALTDMQDEKTTVLVVINVEESVDAETYIQNAINPVNGAGVDSHGRSRGEIVGFAKWSHPIHPGDDHIRPRWKLPKTADWKILSHWLVEVGKVEEKIIGDTPRYELTYLAVEAVYARRGAGRMLVDWALEKCEAEGLPAYVESTVEAVPFYERLGFEEAGRISMDLRSVCSDETAGLYEEVGCIYRPKVRSD